MDCQAADKQNNGDTCILSVAECIQRCDMTTRTHVFCRFVFVGKRNLRERSHQRLVLRIFFRFEFGKFESDAQSRFRRWMAGEWQLVVQRWLDRQRQRRLVFHGDDIAERWLSNGRNDQCRLQQLQFELFQQGNADEQRLGRLNGLGKRERFGQPRRFDYDNRHVRLDLR